MKLGFNLFVIARVRYQPVLYDRGVVMQSYPPRALDRRLQEDWAKDAREGPRVLMSLRIDFGPMG